MVEKIMSQNSKSKEPKLDSLVEIIQMRSTIKRPETQLKTIESLGLGKRNSVVKVRYTAQIRGMVKKVSHLVKIKEIKS